MALDEGQCKALVLAVIIIVVLVLAYRYYKSRCTSSADCTSPQQCISGSCATPAGVSAFTNSIQKDKRRRAIRRRGESFNSDEMNWPTAGSLVQGDTYPYGNLSGYGVSSAYGVATA